MDRKRPCPCCGGDSSRDFPDYTYDEDCRCEHCCVDLPADTGRILDAVEWAVTRHYGQYRSSAAGAKIPYVLHCLEVARTAKFFKLPTFAIEAAILHDVVEDTETTHREVRRVFGDRVAKIVETLTTSGPNVSVKQKLINQRRAIQTMTYYEKVIKIADKMSNVKSIADFEPAWPIKNQRGYVEDASEIVELIKESAWSKTIHNMHDLFQLEKIRALKAIEEREA